MTSDPDGTPKSVAIEFPDLGWKCECDDTSVVIYWQGQRSEYAWEDLDPDSVDLDAEFGQRVLYREPTKIFTRAMQPAGPWSRVTAPGLFFLWIWNAGYRAKQTRPTS